MLFSLGSMAEEEQRERERSSDWERGRRSMVGIASVVRGRSLMSSEAAMAGREFVIVCMREITKEMVCERS